MYFLVYVSCLCDVMDTVRISLHSIAVILTLSLQLGLCNRTEKYVFTSQKNIMLAWVCSIVICGHFSCVANG